MTEAVSDDYDGPWKEAIESYFEDCMAFFFPQAYGDIDWSKGYQFLDKEFQKIVPEAELGRRAVDKLVQVWLKDGQEVWVAHPSGNPKPLCRQFCQTDVYL